MKVVQIEKEKPANTFTIKELEGKINHYAYYDVNNILNINFPEGREVIELKKFIRRSVKDSDYDYLIKEDTIIRERGNAVVFYAHVNYLEDALVNELRRLHFIRGHRSQGLTTYARNFGYLARAKIKRDYCKTAHLFIENKKAHDMLAKLGSLITERYQSYCPEMYDYHVEKANKIKREWKLEDTPFTSGIINKNTALKYHFDTGNIKKVYSNMICFKRDCEGGFLSMPEFRIALEVSNLSLVLMDGQEILHGVTPMKLTTLNGHRFTIVYYSYYSMWQCQPIDEELARIRTVKTEREHRRLKIMRNEIDPEDLLSKVKEDDEDTLYHRKYVPVGHEQELPKKRMKHHINKNGTKTKN